MAVVSVEVRLNDPEIQALLLDRVSRIGRRVQAVAKGYAPYESGRLSSSIFMVAGAGLTFVYADIGTPLAYGLYQHEGTGIYAGRGPIRAPGGKVMRFRPGRAVGPLRAGQEHPARSARGWAWAHEVKGVPPNPYLVAALGTVVGAFARIRRGRWSGRGGGRRLG